MLDLDEGAYNLVFVKLKKRASIDRAVNNLNAAFKSAKIDSDVRAVAWKDSFGILAQFILFFRITLNLIVNFIYFVAIVVIVNTLTMAAMERTYEIGMMRAVGAQKGFIGMMFLTETSLLSFLFGGLGMISGIVIVSITAAAKIPAHSEMTMMVFGGDTFHPILDGSSIVIGIIQLVIVTLIAMIYPLILSRRITPLDALNRD
jgi:ABC-type antimicrobial peptide transport system permease subunit